MDGNAGLDRFFGNQNHPILQISATATLRLSKEIWALALGFAVDPKQKVPF
jgi:hypothetical protein